MNPPVHDRDHELLSTYLDNQLPVAERARLEKRLAAEPQLREALAGLRATVHAIRSLPAVKAPRNFTLDPKVYARRRPASPGQAFGFMRLATALATVFFVAAVAGDFLARGGIAASPAPSAALAPAPEEPLSASVAPANSATAQIEAFSASEAPATEEAPQAPASSVGVGGGESGGGGGSGLDASQSGPTAAAAQLAGTTEQPDLRTASEATETAEEAVGLAADSGTQEAALAPEGTSKLGPATQTPAAVDDASEAAATSEASRQLVQPTATAVAQPFNWLRLAQVAFGLLAVGLALATLWYRSRL